MSCNTDTLDLRGKNLPIIMNEVDTFNLALEFKDDNDLPRDMSASVIYLVINDITVAELGTGITVSGDDNNIVSVVYTITQGIGQHSYAVRVIEDNVDRAELFGRLTIKDV
jgi:hypothetical protein